MILLENFTEPMKPYLSNSTKNFFIPLAYFDKFMSSVVASITPEELNRCKSHIELVTELAMKCTEDLESSTKEKFTSGEFTMYTLLYFSCLTNVFYQTEQAPLYNQRLEKINEEWEESDFCKPEVSKRIIDTVNKKHGTICLDEDMAADLNYAIQNAVTDSINFKKTSDFIKRCNERNK